MTKKWLSLPISPVSEEREIDLERADLHRKTDTQSLVDSCVEHQHAVNIPENVRPNENCINLLIFTLQAEPATKQNEAQWCEMTLFDRWLSDPKE